LTDSLAVYVDTNLIDKVGGQGPLVQNDSNLYFGRHITLGRYFNGLLDDIRLYDGALSQDDVNALFPEPATLLLICGAAAPVLLKRRRS